MDDAEKAVYDAIAELDEKQGFWTVASVYAVYGFYMSLLHGTPEMMVHFQRLAAQYGVFAVCCSVVNKRLKQNAMVFYGR